MPTVVNVGEAKTHLSDLLARVERGEEIVLARAGRPVARLAAIERPRQRRFGTMELHVPDSFFEPLPDEELRAWD